MAYDPREPLPPQGWGQPYPPPGWGQPYGPPPRKDDTTRTVLIVVGSVVAGVVLLPLVLGLLFASFAFVSSSPGPAHREIVESPPESITHERVPADGHGPSFALPAPLGWQVTADRDDPLLGHVRLGFEGHGERIAVASYAEPGTTTPERALAKTVRGLERHGYTASVAPRQGTVGDEPALLQRLRVRDPKKAEVWVMVCVREGARFVVLYEGPPSSLEGPMELRGTLTGWRW